MWITILTELPNDLRIIELVVSQEVLWVLIGIDLDLGQGVMNCGDLDTLSHTVIQPALEHSKLVPLIELIDNLFHGALRSKCLKDLLDVWLVALEIDEGAEDDSAGLWVLADLEQIHFDVLAHVVFVQVPGQLFDLVVGIAQEDNGSGVAQLHLDQQILDFDGVIAIPLILDDLLDDSELADLGASLNILVVDFGVSGVIEDAPQEVVDTLEAPHTLEHLDDIGDAELLDALDADCDDCLEVLPVELEHFGHAGKTGLGGHVRQVFSDVFGWQGVGVHEHSLDVLGIGVVLQGSLVQALLLAQRRDFGLVILVPDLHVEDGVDHLWGSHHVEFEHLGLVDTVFGQVLPHAIEQKTGEFLDAVPPEEHIGDLVDVHVFVLLPQALSELEGSLGVDINHGVESGTHIDWGVCLLSILHGLFLHAHLHHHLDCLLVVLALSVDLESQVLIEPGNHIAQFLAHLQLVVVDPVRNKVDFALGEHGYAQLEGFELGQFALLQQLLEVDQQRLRLVGHLWQRFEFLDGLLVADEAPRGLRRNQSCPSIVTANQQGIELFNEHVVHAWQLIPSGNRKGQLLDVGNVLTVKKRRQEVRLIDHSSNQRTALGDGQDTVVQVVLGDHEDGLLGQPGPEDLLAADHLIDEQEARLGDDVQQAVFLRNDQRNGEVTRVRGVIRDLGVLFVLREAFRGCRNLVDVHFGNSLALLLLNEAEQSGLEGIIVDVGLAEAARVSFEELLPATFDKEQLDMPIDGPALVGSGDSKQCRPLLSRFQAVSDDLGGGVLNESSGPVKNLDFLGSLIVDVDVVHSRVGDDGELGLVDPLPVDDVFGQLDVLELLLEIHIVDLEDVATAQTFIGSLKRHNILGDVHEESLGLVAGLATDAHVLLQVDDGELACTVLG